MNGRTCECVHKVMQQLRRKEIEALSSLSIASFDTMELRYYPNRSDEKVGGAIRFELEAIKAEGYPVTTPLIVCNTDDYAAVAAKASGTVKQGDALLELKH